jgi:hypothetical protein
LTIGGLRVDRAGEAAVVEALPPAGIHAALEALEQMVAQQDIQRQARALALEKARYEAQRASRQYALAEPENRLVAGEWEQRWNEALQRVQDAEAHSAALEQGHVPLRAEQRQQLLTLGQALSAVWHHAAAPEALKKRRLRTVLHEMMIDSTAAPSDYLLRLHWHGGVHTAIRVARHVPGKPGRATEHNVIGVIAELSQVYRDLPTAATLHRLGYRTGTGTAWRAHSVACGRYQ